MAKRHESDHDQSRDVREVAASCQIDAPGPAGMGRYDSGADGGRGYCFTSDNTDSSDTFPLRARVIVNAVTFTPNGP